ncbi:hypothetical protein HY992_03960 [Candidatus Micrarchaeota archaeon]|nr:hypothetical protein [Candidatus Micrarchaeota archaeon]
MQVGKFQNEYAQLLGIHAGDGSVARGRYKWRYSDGDLKAVLYVVELIRKIFGITARVIKDRRTNCWYAEVTNKKFCDNLISEGFPEGKKTSKLSVPKTIKNAGREPTKMFLNVLFGCEATIYRKLYSQRGKKYLLLKLAMCEKEFLFEVGKLLEEMQIPYSIYFDKPSKGSFSRKPRGVIAIFGKNALFFLKNIGLWHPLQREKIKKFCISAELAG